MTTLDALQVDGIRSYFPNDKQTIKFLKPLTLILGSNGCGKTTIIEALRMATTGCLPPNAGHGSSFIHDSKLSQATETKAQIKLRFKTVSGTAMTVSRQFQTQVRKAVGAKPEYKQLEANIKDQTTSKSTSHRCSDIDKIIPELMGVSKAVLENVIFCHQEEANWVLSEPKILKDKFDAIFASTRYSKALDTIRKLQIEQTSTIRTWKVDEKELSMLKEQARTYQKNKELDEFGIEKLRGEVKKIDQDIKERKKILMRCEEALTQHAEIEVEQSQLTTQLKYLEENRLKLLEKVDMEEVEGTTAEDMKVLQHTIMQQIRGEDENKHQFQREMAEKDVELSQYAQQVDKLNKEESMLQAEQMRIRMRQNEWKTLAKDLSGKHRLGVADDALVIEEYPSVVSGKLKKVREEKEKKWQELRTKHNKERDKLNADMAQIDTKIQMSEGQARAKSAEIERLKTSMARLKGQISAIDQQLRGKNLEERKKHHESLQAEFEKMQEDQTYVQREGQLKVLGKKEEELKQDVRFLRERSKVLNQRHGERVIKAQKEKELRELDESITKSFNEIEYAVQTALGKLPALSELKGDIGRHVGACEQRHKELADKKTAQDQQRERVETQRDQIVNLLRQQETEYNQHELATSKLQVDGTAIDAWEESWNEAKDQGRRGEKGAVMKEVIKELKLDIETAKQNLGFLNDLAALTDNYVKEAQDKACCPLCERDFAGGKAGQELRKFVERLQEKKRGSVDPEEQRKSAEDAARQAKELRVLEEALVKVELAASNQQNMKKYEHEILALDVQIAEFDEPSEDGVQLDKAKEDLKEALRIQSTVQDLRLSELSRLKEEVSAFRIDGDAEGRGLEDVTRELEQREGELEELQRQAAKIKKSVDDHRNEIQRQYESIVAARAEYVDMQHQEEQRGVHQRQLDEEQASRDQKEKELQELKDCRVPDSARKEALREEAASMRVAHERDEKALDRDLDDTKQDWLKLEPIEKEVHTYRQLGKDETLERKIRDRREIEGKFREVKRDKDTKEEKRRETLRGLDQHKEDLAKCNDMLELITLRERIATATDTLDERTQALNNLPPKQDVDNEKQKQVKEISKCDKNKYEKLGSISTLEANIRKHDDELKNPKYKGVAQRHKQIVIKLMAMEASNKDLAKYSSALDKALMRFHEMKMEEINKIIKEYWQTTYKGTDIDTIEIKADVDNTANRRSHNYRLIMHTRSGNAQIDMRGRCSAGQKVLASLVVRMALAETFCHSCGILALDEPTSNLDHHNIDGFTDALSRIVNERRRESAGFQLIVISHDDGFIDSLARATAAPTFFKVAKDKETQASKITSHEVSQLD
mmetsp:Transcript_1481/g.3548  ORF Transcript_1481/g.3548 Transcript_1481/m.3548 type:complete len:1339 (+) Transcript_1481:212-4228(+)